MYKKLHCIVYFSTNEDFTILRLLRYLHFIQQKFHNFIKEFQPVISYLVLNS